MEPQVDCVHQLMTADLPEKASEGVTSLPYCIHQTLAGMRRLSSTLERMCSSDTKMMKMEHSDMAPSSSASDV